MKKKQKPSAVAYATSHEHLTMNDEDSVIMTCSRCGKQFLFEEELEIGEDERLNHDPETCLCPQCEAELQE
jgi:DNA-directed RNA polymerase subunit RPC12/RpoP